MSTAYTEQLSALEDRLVQVKRYLRLEEKSERVKEIEHISSQVGFWDDVTAAQVLMSEAGALREAIKIYEAAVLELGDVQAAEELLEEGPDAEVDALCADGITKLKRDLSDLELSSWFDGQFDHGDAIVTVTPGQGGLEAQDWTDMLFHMYMKYCERRGWKVTINDLPTGDVIGIDRATFTVSGRDVYGMLSAEAGVHRLVRISPTDVKQRRQTTFAGVEVLPVIPEEIEVGIDPTDLRIDVYHSGGPGGQGVNTTDSAVRITHLPTGIVVTCQNERSQLQNKAFAMTILRSRLFELELAKREEQLEELRGPKREISFGNQIRSYVLYPYQLIKDLRSGYETGNVEGVLSSGDLDPFIEAYHRWRVLNQGNTSTAE